MKKGFAPVLVIIVLFIAISAVWAGIFLINKPVEENEATSAPDLTHCAQYHDVGYMKGLYGKSIDDQSENIEIPLECKDIHDQAFEKGSVERERQLNNYYDSKRRSDLLALGNVIYQYAVNNNGELPSGIGNEFIEIGTSEGNLDISNYIELYHLQKDTNPDLFDPEDGSEESTKYTIRLDPDTGRIKLESKSSENPEERLFVIR